MAARNEIEEAILLMQEMGISRKQAVKALSRYNYDVGRAADYIFSGNADNESDSDHDDDANGRVTTATTPTPTVELSSTSPWDDDMGPHLFGSTKPRGTPNSVTDSPELKGINGTSATAQSAAQGQLVKDYGRERDPEPVEYDPAIWSVVPASSSMTPADPVVPTAGAAAAAASTTTTKGNTLNRNSLTWWYDPYDPSERARKSGICIGLRPPPYDFTYVPIILQALYHISVFQYMILTYRPVPFYWGSPRGYWSGEGEEIPCISSTSAVRVEPSLSPTGPENADEEKDRTSHNNDILSSDDDSLLGDEGQNSSSNGSHTELMVLPESVRALAELQKIFGFLRNTKRQYGDVRTFVRVLNAAEHARRGWNTSDMTVEDFFDLLFRCFSGAESHQDPPSDSSLLSLFSLKSRDDCEGDIDNNELYYLPLKFDGYARTFHDCFGPLVYDSKNKYEISIDETSSINTESTASDAKSRLITFEVVSPILIVTLTDKSERFNKHNPNKYLADKTIYMDRYLYENKDEALRRYEQADQWREEIRKAKAEISKLSLNNVHVCQEQHTPKLVDKRELLTKTMEYFQTIAFDNIDGTMVASLQNVLANVKERITRRLDELREVEENSRANLKTLFDTPELRKRPYDIRALLHNDGGNGPGHHWGYIWVEEGNLPEGASDKEGQWFRFCDALVTPVTEAEVFDEPTSPFAVVYVDRNANKVSKSDLDGSIPQGLQDFIDKDNALFEEDIKGFGQVDKGEGIDSDARASDAFRTDDDGSDTFNDTESFGTIGSSEVLIANNSESSDEFGYAETMEFHAEEYSPDDYHLMEDFENFLAKIKCSSAIEIYHEAYVMANTDDTEPPEKKSRRDPELSPLWFEYDTFVSIARTVTNALIAFIEDRYNDAVMWFLEAKRQEASWKQHLAVDTLLLEDHPQLLSIGFQRLTTVFGKVCVKILENAAYKKASDPAYCTRGLQEASTIAHAAQAIIGPEKIAEDQLFNEMRERWLGFSETQGPMLQDGQVELLDSLIMTFLESEGGDDNDISMSPPNEALKALPETGPLLAPVYRQACLDAGSHLDKLEKALDE